MKIHNFLTLVLTLLLAATAASRVEAAGATELPGAKDSSFISRYAGSILQNAASESFAAVRVPAGPGHFGTGDKLVFDKVVPVEGKVSAYFYVGPKQRSALEVFRNYQTALAQGGFATMYSCEIRACDDARIREHLTNEVVRPRKWANGHGDPSSAISSDIRFVSSKATRNGADVHVMVFVAEPDSVWQAPTAVVIVAEPAAMDTGKVTVSSEQLQKGLAADGRIALYGIYFDTARAEVKPESKAQLDEMARLLTKERSLKVLIVGHTDNQGGVDANLALSQRRADAVVAALVANYKVDATRLKARGVASFAPVATNRSESGRAKNRRVELVEQ